MFQRQSGNLAKPSEISELQEIWARSRRAYRESPASRSAITESEVTESEGVDAKECKNALGVMSRFWPFDNRSGQVMDVPLGKLVTPQLSVTIERIERQPKISKSASDYELFQYLSQAPKLSFPVDHEIIAMAGNGGSFLFTSENEDIRPLPSTVRRLRLVEGDDASPALETLCIPVGGGMPHAYGVRVPIQEGQSRIIVLNGIHRIANLAKLGLRTIPLPICDVEVGDLPPQLADLPTAFLVNFGTNVPLISDFWREGFAGAVEYFRQIRGIRVNWNSEVYPISLKSPLG
jgi:hypothetical protein